MKLPDGVTLHTGGRKYKGEIPDNCVPKKLNKAKLNKRLKEQEDAKKLAKPAADSKAN